MATMVIDASFDPLGVPMVYIVDNDSEVRERLHDRLAPFGIDVRGFETAEEFLRTFAPGGAQCIVTEVDLPGINGLQLQERLNAAHVDVPVLMLASHSDVPLAVRAMQNGAVDFMEKPFIEELLVSRIRQVLRRWRPSPPAGA